MEKLKVELELTKLLSGLKVSDLEQLIKEASALVIRKKAKDNKQLESDLLFQLNHVYVPSQEHLNQFFELAEKRDKGIISTKELKQLQLLIDEEEAFQVERIKIVGKLSQLWEIPMMEVVKKLGLKPKESA